MNPTLQEHLTNFKSIRRNIDAPVTLQMNCDNTARNINITRKNEDPHKSYFVTQAASLHLTAMSFQTGKNRRILQSNRLQLSGRQTSPKVERILLFLPRDAAVFGDNNSLPCVKTVLKVFLFSVVLIFGSIIARIETIYSYSRPIFFSKPATSSGGCWLLASQMDFA